MAETFPIDIEKFKAELADDLYAYKNATDRWISKEVTALESMQAIQPIIKCIQSAFEKARNDQDIGIIIEVAESTLTAEAATSRMSIFEASNTIGAALQKAGMKYDPLR